MHRGVGTLTSLPSTTGKVKSGVGEVGVKLEQKAPGYLGGPGACSPGKFFTI